MKILGVTGIRPHKLGGFERYCIGFSRYLLSRGHEHMLFFNGEPCPELRKGLEVLEIPFFNRRFQNIGIRDALFLARFVLMNKVDIVHLHFCGVPYNMFTLIAALLPCRVYLTYHMALMPNGSNFLLDRVKKARNRLLGIGVNRFICVSEYCKKSFVATYFEKADKLAVIYNGLDVGDFPVRARKVPAAGAYRVICVASLTGQKGVADLLQAAVSVAESVPSLELTIIGTGPLESELRKLSYSLGIEANTHFLGLRSDVPQLLACSDVAVLPSRFDEAFGFSVIEAMAARTPLVATMTGGVPEIVDETTAVLVPPNAPEEIARALVELYENYESGLRLADEGRKRVEERFSTHAVCENQMKVYTSSRS